MIYIFIKDRRNIKVENSRFWVGGEIEEGMDIVVRKTWFHVKEVFNHGSAKSIVLTDIKNEKGRNFQ